MIKIGHVAIQAALRNRPGVRGVAVDVTGAIDPFVAVGDVSDVVLIETVFVPIQIRLSHFRRSHDDFHRDLKAPVKKIDALKKLITSVNHFKGHVGVGGLKRVGAGFKASVDRRFIDRSTCLVVRRSEKRLILLSVAFLALFGSDKSWIVMPGSDVHALLRRLAGAKRDFDAAAVLVFADEPNVFVWNQTHHHVTGRFGESRHFRFVTSSLLLRFLQITNLVIVAFRLHRVVAEPGDDRDDRNEC